MNPADNYIHFHAVSDAYLQMRAEGRDTTMAVCAKTMLLNRMLKNLIGKDFSQITEDDVSRFTYWVTMLEQDYDKQLANYARPQGAIDPEDMEAIDFPTEITHACFDGPFRAEEMVTVDRPFCAEEDGPDHSGEFSTPFSSATPDTLAAPGTLDMLDAAVDVDMLPGVDEELEQLLNAHGNLQNAQICLWEAVSE